MKLQRWKKIKSLECLKSERIHEKNIWNIRHLVDESLSHRPSKPEYYVVDCRISKLGDKIQNLLNIQPEIWNWKYQSVHLSEPIYFIHFNMRHPVVLERKNRTSKKHPEYCWLGIGVVVLGFWGILYNQYLKTKIS